MKDQWENTLDKLEKIIGKKPDNIASVLFLIGLQKLGFGKKSYTKEQKQDVIHIGMCEILQEKEICQFASRDADGWPQYQFFNTTNQMVKLDQEVFIKDAISYLEKLL